MTYNEAYELKDLVYEEKTQGNGVDEAEIEVDPQDLEKQADHLLEPKCPVDKQFGKKNPKKKPRKPRKKKNNDELNFLDEIIAENVQHKAELIDMGREIKMRCTYCQPTVSFEHIDVLRDHMLFKHSSAILFVDQPAKIKEQTLKFHREFSNATGVYPHEIS